MNNTCFPQCSIVIRCYNEGQHIRGLLSGVMQQTIENVKILWSALTLPQGTERLLLRTRNSGLWAAEVTDFRKDYVALTDDAVSWIKDQGIRLIGVDYLSVQRYRDREPTTHKTLLEAGTVIVEGLNLSAVRSGNYDFVCLPLKLVGSEGAPARAILIDKGNE